MTLYSFTARGWDDELERAVERCCERFDVYPSIPGVFFGTTSPQGAEQVATLPGVRGYRPATDGMRRVVSRIHQQLTVVRVNQLKAGVNGIAKATTVHLPDGAPVCPTLTSEAGVPVWGLDESIRRSTRLCVAGALNISLQMLTRVPYDVDDPICLAATAASRYLPVVFAAGNVDDDPDPSMFGWPCSPSVIAVGGTGPQGQALLGSSRRGDPDRGIPGPDVVANGIDETGAQGTSFAAPVVSTALALMTAALLTLRSSALHARGVAEGVPLVARHFVDIGVLPGQHEHGELVNDFAPRTRPLPSLPMAGVRVDAVEPLLAATGGTDSGLLALPSPDMLRRMLVASAVPVPGASEAEVGAGFVSLQTTEDFLARLSVGRLAGLLGTHGIDDDRLVFDDLLPAFLDGARDSMLGWASDITEYGTDEQYIFVEPPTDAGLDAAPRG